MHTLIRLPKGRLLPALLLLVWMPVGLASCLIFGDSVPDISDANTGPYLTSERNLEAVKTLTREDPLYEVLLERLLVHADSLLQLDERYSVTFQSSLSPSEDPHDYVSIGRYLWPDPDNPGTWMLRDSQTSPHIHDYDRGALGKLSSSVRILSLAYYFSGRQAYAERTADLIRTWFLDQETYMKPHFKHAQFWPGKNSGQAQGIIEAADFISVIEAASLIYDSPSWSPREHRDLKYWFYDFMHWVRMNYSTESFADANVGTWIDVQKTLYALFTERTDLLTSTSYLMPINERVARQISIFGEQPGEMARWRSQDYVWFNLKAYIWLIELRTHAGLRRQAGDGGLFTLNAESDSGSSILSGLDWFYSYASGSRSWTGDGFQQIGSFDPCRLIEIYRPAALSLDRPDFDELVSSLLGNPVCHRVTTLMTHPPLHASRP